MSEASDHSRRSVWTDGKVILIQRDHELSDIASLLTEIGTKVEHCTTGLPDKEALAEADLVVASAQRLLESPPPHLSSWPRTLVAVRDPSKTLSAHLHRIGVSMILCQPVHPQTLRLLLLHSIYRGPERRLRKRTPIGHQVRVRSGLFRTKATLLELSPTGARLQMARMPKLGTKLRIRLGKELTSGRPLRLETKVIRRIDALDKATRGQVQVGLSILNADLHTAAIKEVLTHFADGPATWKAGAKNSTAPDSRSRAEVRVTGASVESSSPADADLIDEAAFAEEVADGPPSREACNATLEPYLDIGEDDNACERRTNARVPYNRRVVALDEEAARVLVGCDLSPGGMRVLSNSSISVNDRLRVALHCGTHMEPVVVTARALRDDGEDGLVLLFEELTPEQSTHLEKILANSGSIRSPLASNRASEEADQSLFVGELLETMPEEDLESADSDDPEDVHLEP